MRLIIISSLLLIAVANYAQSYTSYFTGSSTNVTTQPDGGICLMGGATENDEAMKWFLQRANGGDILVLRASGSDGYNDYLYAELGVTVNSVETIVFNTADAVNDFYVQTRIQNAEAIWFAGGDQWNYVNYWKNSPVETLVNNSIQQRNIVIGGTSAGMAILGSHYFSAQNGTVTSATALANPFHNLVSIGGNDFLNAGVLGNTITDTHYDNPDRRGRHVVFMARMATDFAIEPRGIACDEYT
ncbi:MAG: cyanophycinase, partial [Bacteroidales bacterium]|nr:cyanophycinase [Bacteroidales bacterium]